MSRIIPLTQGMAAQVDARDYARVMRFKWFARRSLHTWYAYTAMGKLRDRRMVALHQFILGESVSGMWVDHRNLNGLDCRRRNLRHSTPSQNNHNRPANKGRKFKGVFVNGSGFMAQIMVNRKLFHLGTFNTPEEAAAVYNAKAAELVGRFARANRGAAVVIRPRVWSVPARHRTQRGVQMKGVVQRRARFRARIWQGGKVVNLGTFNTSEEAAAAYANAAGDSAAARTQVTWRS